MLLGLVLVSFPFAMLTILLLLLLGFKFTAVTDKPLYVIAGKERQIFPCPIT